MRLEMRSPSDTDGTILMHNIADRDGRQILRKGIRLGPEHAGQLVRLGLDGWRLECSRTMPPRSLPWRCRPTPSRMADAWQVTPSDGARAAWTGSLKRAPDPSHGGAEILCR